MRRTYLVLFGQSQGPLLPLQDGLVPPLLQVHPLHRLGVRDDLADNDGGGDEEREGGVDGGAERDLGRKGHGQLLMVTQQDFFRKYS